MSAFATELPCDLNVRVGANSPRRWPTMFSVMKIGMCWRPLWIAKVRPTKSGSTIERRPPEEQAQLRYLRTVFPSLLITGPFSIILGFTGGLMALNDRLKLRSMVTAEKGDRVYIASEEAAIRAMEPDAENFYAPAGGEPVIVRVKEGCY